MSSGAQFNDDMCTLSSRSLHAADERALEWRCHTILTVRYSFYYYFFFLYSTRVCVNEFINWHHHSVMFDFSCFCSILLIYVACDASHLPLSSITRLVHRMLNTQMAHVDQRMNDQPLELPASNGNKKRKSNLICFIKKLKSMLGDHFISFLLSRTPMLRAHSECFRNSM